MARMRGLYLGTASSINRAYAPHAQAELARMLEMRERPLSAEQVRSDPALLRDVDVLMSTWGMVTLDAEVLDATESLKLVCYAAGSVKCFVTDALWARGIRLTHAAAQNAVPVAEFTAALVVMALKQAFRAERQVRATQRFDQPVIVGAYQNRVGLVSMGVIGRLTAERLKSLDVEVVAYDPAPSAALSASLGVTYVSLAELFSTCDVVSLHTPWLPTTERMINEPLLSSMRPGAALINTSRGAVVDETDLIAVFSQRPDLSAYLDVTHPEPPVASSPLYTLPNVVLFPHIAGSVGREVWRMGDAMVQELQRFIAGEPLQQEVVPHMLATMA